MRVWTFASSLEQNCTPWKQSSCQLLSSNLWDGTVSVMFEIRVFHRDVEKYTNSFVIWLSVNWYETTDVCRSLLPPPSSQRCHTSSYSYRSLEEASCFAGFYYWRNRKIAKSACCLRHASTCTWNNSAPTGRIFIKFYIWIFCETLPENSSFIKTDKSNGYLTRKICIFMIISCWILLTTRNVSEKSSRENHNTHFMLSNIFPKIEPFRRYCVRVWYSQTSHSWKYNMALLQYQLDT